MGILDSNRKLIVRKTLSEIQHNPVYIAYSKSSRDVAFEINHTLKGLFIDTWIDFEHLPPNESKHETLRQHAISDASLIIIILPMGQIDGEEISSFELDAVNNKISRSLENNPTIIINPAKTTFLKTILTSGYVIDGGLDDIEHITMTIQSVLNGDFKNKTSILNDTTLLPVPSIKEKVNHNLSGEKSLFLVEEVDLFTRPSTNEYFIFHGKFVDYSLLKSFELHYDQNRIKVNLLNGHTLDLGIELKQRIMRNLSKASHVDIIRTRDGESIERLRLPIQHIKDERKKTPQLKHKQSQSNTVTVSFGGIDVSDQDKENS